MGGCVAGGSGFLRGVQKRARVVVVVVGREGEGVGGQAITLVN